jgi:hypothetical protein
MEVRSKNCAVSRYLAYFNHPLAASASQLLAIGTPPDTPCFIEHIELHDEQAFITVKHLDITIGPNGDAAAIGAPG